LDEGQQCAFEKSELILRAIDSLGRVSLESPFCLTCFETKAKRQTAKEPEKMSAQTLFWPEAGFSNFY
jgi:hypothetical protein